MRDEAEHKGDGKAVGLGARRCRDAEGVSFSRTWSGLFGQPVAENPTQVMVEAASALSGWTGAT